MGGGTMQYEHDIATGKECRSCDAKDLRKHKVTKDLEIEIKTWELAILKGEQSATGDWAKGYVRGLQVALEMFNK